jgi:hypothetical protein
MKVKYDYAVVSYCPDLMDPHAKPVLLGVVGLATGLQDTLLCMVVRRSRQGWKELTRDTLMHYALEELPACLERLALEGLKKAGPSKAMLWVGRHLTQSIYISAVREKAGTVPVEGRSLVTSKLVAEFTRLYERELTPTRTRRPARSVHPLVGVRPLRRAPA